MLKEFLAYLAAETGRVIGDTLQKGQFVQGAPDTCSMVKRGSSPGPWFSPSITQARFQILTRAKEEDDADTEAQVFYDLLHGKTGIRFPIVAGGPQFVAETIIADSTPQSIGRDKNGRWEFSVNYTIQMKEET